MKADKQSLLDAAMGDEVNTIEGSNAWCNAMVRYGEQVTSTKAQIERLTELRDELKTKAEASDTTHHRATIIKKLRLCIKTHIESLKQPA